MAGGIATAVRAGLAGLWGRAGARAVAWSRRRHGSDHGTVTIGSRRIYIVPTRLGVGYAALLFAMLLAGLNYANNLALALTFLLAAAGWVAMHACHRNLKGLSITPAGTRAPFAGAAAEFAFTLAAPAAHEDIVLVAGGRRAGAASVAPGRAALARVQLPTSRRGRVRLGRLRLESRFPLGLFTAWTWLHPDVDCLVYPRPAAAGAAGPPPAADAGAAHDGRARGEEDFAGLVPFRPGDAPRRIAWKAWARGGELQVKAFTGAARAPVMLDLEDAPGTDLEARLARLARWIVDAERRGDRYGVRAGREELRPGGGLAHRNRCLALLATYRLPAS
jgi:uncharacterized protein (DUF58 family)